MAQQLQNFTAPTVGSEEVGIAPVQEGGANSGVGLDRHPERVLELRARWSEDASSTLRAEFFEYWKKCEDIAVHFNDLGARFRLQALAGVGFAATILGSIKSVGSGDGLHVGYGFVALLIVWIAVAVIDNVYYVALLTGAVDEIGAIERASDFKFGLSRSLNKTAGMGRSARVLFYAIVGFSLLIGATVFWPRATAECCVPARASADGVAADIGGRP